jgi:hypothetical protein
MILLPSLPWRLFFSIAQPCPDRPNEDIAAEYDAKWEAQWEEQTLLPQEKSK